ncbi:MAG: c-type cytochrome [Thermodesulfobacteriota bacterium]
MEKKGARNFFIWGTVICTAVFIWLTIDTHTTIPKRTNTNKLTDEVVQGKRVWHRYNCNDCHTILGIGGYYSPDVTKTYSTRGENWLRAFLKNPETPDPQRRKMPNQNLSDDEINKLIAFFKWVDAIDTNEWPPTPITVAKKTGVPLKETALVVMGRNLYNQNRCDLCHQIGGQGGMIGPDLSRVGTKYDAQWLGKKIKDPKSLNPNTQMPAYTQLTDEEIQALTAFLGGLK